MVWNTFFSMFARLTEGGVKSYLANARMEATHFKKGLPSQVLSINYSVGPHGFRELEIFLRQTKHEAPDDVSLFVSCD